MPNLKFHIDKSKIDKNGLVPIRATISIENKNRVKVIEKVKPRYWNPRKQRVNPNRETEPDNRHVEINSLLDEYQAKAKEFFNHCLLNKIPLTEKLVVDFFNGKDFKRNRNNNFNVIFREFLEVTRNTKTLATLKNRTTVFKFLEAFQEWKQIRLTLHESDIDLSFYDCLTDYAYNVRNTKNNYFAKITAVLKTFLNWAFEREYYTGTKHRKFQAPEKNIDIICLTQDELNNLCSFTFSNSKLDRVRDFYCFGCFTGLRFIDIKQLRREHLVNGYILKTIQKTQEPARIPILPQAKKILDKYDHPVFVLPQISNQKFNDYIKECCKLAGINQKTRITTFIGNNTKEEIKPKYELITAHTARKTFITLSVYFGMEVKVIKKITGHIQDKTFDKYLEIADEMKKEHLNKAWTKL